MYSHFFILSLFLSFLNGSETDSYTFRSLLFSDAYPYMNSYLNNITNLRFQAALNQIPYSKNCSKEALENAVIPMVGDRHVAGVNLMIGAIEHELNLGQSDFLKHSNGSFIPLPIMRTPTAQHIYSVFDLIDERGFVTSNKIIEFVNFKILTTKNETVNIGSDKTAHFFSQGWEYYQKLSKMTSQYGQSTLPKGFLQEFSYWSTIFYGVMTEIQNYGLGFDQVIDGTDIFSYADLATNLAGLRFWQNFSPLHGTSTDPYFQCKDGKWTQNKLFRWEDYITPAWDESINANEFRTPEMKQKFMQRIELLYLKGKLPRDTFPMNEDYCKGLQGMENDFLMKFILNPSCYALAVGNQTYSVMTAA